MTHLGFGVWRECSSPPTPKTEVFYNLLFNYITLLLKFSALWWFVNTGQEILLF